MNSLNKSLKNFISAASGNLGGQILGFLVATYLARVLGPQGYGVFTFAQTYAAYFLIFSDLGISLYCIREINHSENKIDIAQDAFSIKFYLSIFSTLILLLSLLFLQKPFEVKASLAFISISVLFSGMGIDYLFIAQNNMKFIGISTLLKNLLFYLLCLCFIHGQKGMIYSTVFYSVGIIAGSMYLFIMFQYKYYPLKLKMLKKKHLNMLKASLPLAFSGLMIQVSNKFDILYLSFTSYGDEVGYYSAAYTIINFLLSILVVYFNSSYATIAELFRSSKTELSRYIEKMFKIGMFFVTPVVFGGAAVSVKLMVFLYGKSFVKSGNLFLLLIPIIYLRMVSSTFGAVLIMGDKSKEFFKGVAAAAVINILMNIILIPYLGAVGSAISTITCELTQCIYLYYYYRMYCKTSLVVSSIRPIISSTIMIYGMYYFNVSLIKSILIGIILYFSASFVIGFIIKTIKKRIKY